MKNMHIYSYDFNEHEMSVNILSSSLLFVGRL